MDEDPYDILRVSQDASEQELKEAYREKVKKYHPDASDRDDSTEAFKRVRKAYEAVSSRDEGGSGTSHDTHQSRGMSRTSTKSQRGRARERGRTDTNPGGVGGLVQDLLTYAILIYIVLTILEAVTRFDFPIPPS
jgi:molecular chaperone DnaJ